MIFYGRWFHCLPYPRTAGRVLGVNDIIYLASIDVVLAVPVVSHSFIVYHTTTLTCTSRRDTQLRAQLAHNELYLTLKPDATISTTSTTAATTLFVLVEGSHCG
jgi:hypothetical protein